MNWQPRDVSPDARRAAEAASDAAGVPLKDWFADMVRAAILRELGRIPDEEPEAGGSAEPDPSPPSAEPTGSVSTARRDEAPRESPIATSTDPAPAPTSGEAPSPAKILEIAREALTFMDAASPPIAEPEPIIPTPVVAEDPPAPPPVVEPAPLLSAPIEATVPVDPTPPIPPEPPIPSTMIEITARPPAGPPLVEPRRLTDPGFSTWLATRIQGLPARATPATPSIPSAAPPTPASAPAAMSLRIEPSPPAPVVPIPAAPAPLLQPAPAAEKLTAPAAPSEMPLPLSLPSGPVTTLRLTSLRPARIRSRRASDVDLGIASLAGSVAAHGVREPILVRRLAEKADQYEVVAGERRRLAAERASRADVPAVIVDAQDAETLLLSLTENLGRGDFSPLDEARAYLRLLTEYRVSPSALAQRLARERSHIALVLRLLGLPPKVRQLIDSGRLGSGQAFLLLSAPDPDAMAEQMVLAAPGGPARDPGEHL